MEQTIQEAVQQTGESAAWNWLQLIAAIGTLVSVITLALQIGFRVWDSKTRTNSTFLAERERGRVPVLVLRVINRSKTSIYMPDEGAFETKDGKPLAGVTLYRGHPGGPPELKPALFANYFVEMPVLSKHLIQQGYTRTASLKFVVCDGTGHCHKQPMLIAGLEEWDKNSEGPDPIEPPPPPLSWRWFR
jgi:hypothetical protein